MIEVFAIFFVDFFYFSAWAFRQSYKKKTALLFQLQKSNNNYDFLS